MATRKQNREDTSFNPDELEKDNAAAAEMEEVEGEQIPEPFKFATIGDCISGDYVRTDEVEGEYKKQRVYIIRAASNGNLYTVYGNTDLNSKMKKVALGSKVSLEFTSEEPMPGDLSPRRIITVKASKKAGSAAPVVNGKGPRKL